MARTAEGEIADALGHCDLADLGAIGIVTVDPIARPAPEPARQVEAKAIEELARVGRKDLAAAQKCLDLAKGARLLPEEQRLVNEARARINSTPPTKPSK